MIEAVTEIYHNGRTHAEHCAWLDALTGDDYRIVHTPLGNLFEIALASAIKYHLLNTEMASGQRLQFLDGLAGMIGATVTETAIAAIEPADPVGLDMMQAVNEVAIPEQIQTFRKGDVFRLMAQLNPSLLKALKLCRWPDLQKQKMGDMQQELH